MTLIFVLVPHLLPHPFLTFSEHRWRSSLPTTQFCADSSDLFATVVAVDDLISITHESCENRDMIVAKMKTSARRNRKSDEPVMCDRLPFGSKS